MDSRSLMIGDWVNWHTYTDRPNYCHITNVNDREYDCEPIPLTAEILKKNGFKDAPRKDTDAHNLAGKWWHKSGDVYVKRYCLNHGTYAYTVGFHPYTRIENLHYVHQLQHALRLCGFDELADNFKV